MILYFYTIDYLDQYSFYFSHPISWRFVGMLLLHDYICYYMIIVSVFVIVFYVYAIFYYILTDYFFQKERIYDYVRARIYKFSHAPYIEWIWIAIPFLFLLLIIVPSFKLLYALDKLEHPAFTVIIYGNQWYRTYEYSNFNVVTLIMEDLNKINYLEFVDKYLIKEKSQNILTNEKLNDIISLIFTRLKHNSIETNFNNHFLNDLNRWKNFEKFNNFSSIINSAHDTIQSWKNFNKSEVDKFNNNFIFINFMSKMLRSYDDIKISFDSIILPDEDLPIGYPRLLATDQVLLLPYGPEIRLLMTSNDVIHSWALPAYGIKTDAVPGRLNHVAFEALFGGTNWGQCSELCGINHGFMPIEVRVLRLNDFKTYIKLNLVIKYDKFIPIVLEHIKNFSNTYYKK